MFWIVYVFLFTGMIFFVLRRSKRIRSQRKYNYRRDQGIYYFENGDFILNYVVPQYTSVENIDHVCFTYDIWSVENRKRYSFDIKIVNKDGSETRSVPYTSFSHGNNVLRPKDIAATLESQGIACTLPTGRGSYFRGNQ